MKIFKIGRVEILSTQLKAFDIAYLKYLMTAYLNATDNTLLDRQAFFYLGLGGGSRSEVERGGPYNFVI